MAEVTEANNSAYLDFMARRLVEMAGYLIMAYLLLLDAKTDESFKKSAVVYTNMVAAEITKHAEFISSFSPEELKAYNIN